MGDTNRVALRHTREGTPGTTPANPVFNTICHTGVTLSGSPQTIQSERICGGNSRGVEDLPLVGVDIGEGFSFEYYFAGLDSLLEGLFQNAWTLRYRRANTAASDPVSRPTSAQITGVSTSAFTVTASTALAEGTLIHCKGFTNSGNNGLKVVGASATTTSITVSGLTTEASPPTTAEIHGVGVQGATGDLETTTTSGNAIISTTLDLTTLGLTAGQWIKIGGTAAGVQFGTAAVNDFVRVSAVATNRISLDVVPTGWAADNGSGKTIQLFFGDYLRDGVTKVTETIEVDFQDLAAQTWEYFRGLYADTFSLSGDSQQIVTGSMGFLGLSESITETRFSGASTIASNGNKSLQTASNVARIAEGGSRLGSPTFLTQFELSVNNNSRRKNAWAVVGAAAVGSGDFGVTGSLTTYFESKALREKVINNTESSVDVAWRDADNQVVLFDIPRLKYSDGAPNVPGRNQDVTLQLSYTGLRHATLGYTLHHQRFWYAPASS